MKLAVNCFLILSLLWPWQTQATLYVYDFEYSKHLMYVKLYGIGLFPHNVLKMNSVAARDEISLFVLLYCWYAFIVQNSYRFVAKASKSCESHPPGTQPCLLSTPAVELCVCYT